MSFATLLRRLIVFLLAPGIPAGLFGLAVAGARGAIAAELILGIVLLGLALWSERGFLKAYAASATVPDGARRSLERVIASVGGHAPAVRVIPDASVRALVVRGPGSSGTLLLSEGLLGVLGEAELRQLLQACVTRLRARGMVFQTLCAWMAHLALEAAPRAWTELLFGELRQDEALGPLGALRFAASFAVARFLVSLGRASQPAGMGANDAPRSYVALSRWSSGVANPGSCILHLADPWSERALFPL